MSKYEPIEIDVYVHHQTENAVLVSETGNEKHAVWLPRSQVRELNIKKGYEVGTASIVIPEWLAQDKGLI